MLEDAGTRAGQLGTEAHAPARFGIDYQDIADDVMAETKELGGTGGVIVIGPEGEMVWSFNTPGMYRGKVSSDGQRVVAFYGED